MCQFLHARPAAFLATVKALAVLLASTLPNLAFSQFAPPVASKPALAQPPATSANTPYQDTFNIYRQDPTIVHHLVATDVSREADADVHHLTQAVVERQEPTTVEEQLAAIRTELDALRKERDEEMKKAAKKKEEEDAKKKTDDAKKNGWIDISSEKWNVRMGGHVQMDYIMWPNTDPQIIDPAEGNYFSFRRLRLAVDGNGYGVFDFRLQMTLEPGQGSDTNAFGSPDVKDAYLTMNEIPILGRMRFGNFFVPFGLEQVTNDTMNIFNERSIPSQGIFTPDREIGIAFYNATADQNISWATGLFFDNVNDTFKTRIDDNQGYRVSGRLTWLPYYDEPSDGRYLVHTGVGVLYTDDQDDRIRFSARPQVQRGPVLIDSGNLVADDYITGNLELAVICGRVTWQNEAYLTKVNMQTGDAINVGGAYSHISYFLTGENRVYERFGQHGSQFGRNKPFSNFFITPGGYSIGAWEAKARWSYLDLTEARRGQYNDVTVGFNWYWSDRIRWMFDWIHPFTDANTTFGSTESDLLALRMDFNW